jgi:glycosyltransferase involved in cell wall biosynthesis
MDYSKIQGFQKEIKNKKIYKQWYYQVGVLKLLFKYNRFLLIGEPYCISTWVLLLTAWLLRKKVFFWTHGWYGDENWVKIIAKKIFFGLSKGIFLYGNYACNLMIKAGISSSKLHIIYNSLDYDKQLRLRETMKPSSIIKQHFNNDYPISIFMGRLTPAKQLALYLKAQKQLLQDGYPLNVVIVGDGEGEYESSLKNLSAELGLKSYIWFYGACYKEVELAPLIYNAELCVSPGEVGLTAIHSMMYGTPVITHNDFTKQMPEFEAIQEGITGSFFERDNIDSLKTCIWQWFQKYPRKTDDLRQNCYKIIDEKYNPHYQINVFKRILQPHENNND